MNNQTQQYELKHFIHGSINPSDTESSASIHKTDERQSDLLQLHEQLNQNQKQTGIWQKIKSNSAVMLMDSISQNNQFASVYFKMTSFQKDRFRQWYKSILDFQALNQRQQRLAEQYFDQNIQSAHQKQSAANKKAESQKCCSNFLKCFRQYSCEEWIALILLLIGFTLGLILFFTSQTNYLKFDPQCSIPQNQTNPNTTSIKNLYLDNIYLNDSQKIEQTWSDVKCIKNQVLKGRFFVLVIFFQGVLTFITMAMALSIKILWTSFKKNVCCWGCSKPSKNKEKVEHTINKQEKMSKQTLKDKEMNEEIQKDKRDEQGNQEEQEKEKNEMKEAIEMKEAMVFTNVEYV